MKLRITLSIITKTFIAKKQREIELMLEKAFKRRIVLQRKGIEQYDLVALRNVM